MIAALLLLVAQDLNSVLDSPKLAGAIVSCTVLDESGKLLFERNSNLRVMPASNEKLVTCAFALWKLGPDYRPETRIWKQKNRVVVDSPGDPMMTHERLEQAARILQLNGKLPVFVRQAYRPLIGPSWEWDDLPNKYAAPITAFTVDRGSVELWCEGNKLEVQPRSYWLKPKRGQQKGSPKVVYDPERRTLLVDGELPRVRTRLDTLALDLPDVAAASYLGKGFQLTTATPKSAPSLSLGGKPLKDQMKECLEKSDNNIAENLLLMASKVTVSESKPAYDVACEALSKFLTDTVGLEPDEFKPSDGSGMSRHNLVTTRGLAKLLLWARQQPSKEVWMSSLAKPGVGTLKERLADVPFLGKTGTLDAVVALSGYVFCNERPLTISLVLNHFRCSEKEARQLADQFVKNVAAYPLFGTVSARVIGHEARSAFPPPYAPTGGWDR